MTITAESTSDGYRFLADGRPVGLLKRTVEPQVTSTDELHDLGNGAFKIVRHFTVQRGMVPEQMRLTLDFVADYRATYSLIPAVSYNGNEWGTGQDPKGFVHEGTPWSFASHRISIPAATYSEGDGLSVALFGNAPTEPGGLACSLIPAGSHTTHRLIWPEEEQPKVYTGRDEYGPPKAA